MKVAEHLIKVFNEYNLNVAPDGKHVNTTTDGGGNFRKAYKVYGQEEVVDGDVPEEDDLARFMGTDDDFPPTAREARLLDDATNFDLIDVEWVICDEVMCKKE